MYHKYKVSIASQYILTILQQWSGYLKLVKAQQMSFRCNAGSHRWYGIMSDQLVTYRLGNSRLKLMYPCTNSPKLHFTMYIHPIEWLCLTSFVLRQVYLGYSGWRNYRWFVRQWKDTHRIIFANTAYNSFWVYTYNTIHQYYGGSCG